MTENHPITPSPFQLDQWEAKARATTDPSLLNEPAIRAGRFGVVHRKALCLAFAAGADQELGACCDWLSNRSSLTERLRAARRPKPLSLKEQAQRILVENGTTTDGRMELDPDDIGIIFRALEALPE